MIRLLPRLLPWCALCVLTACSTNAPSVDGGDEGEGEGEGEGPREGEGEGELPGEGEGEGEDDVAASIAVAPEFGVPADGVSAVTVTIQLTGSSIAGRAIGVSTEVAGPDIPAGVVTSVDGSARVLLTSSVPGTFVLEVEVDGRLVDVAGATVSFRPCTSLNDTFLTQTWPAALSRCIGCHNEFGYAPMMGARFVLPFAGDDNFAERGVAAVRDILDLTADDAIDVSTLSDEQKAIAQIGPDDETIPRALANALFGVPPDADGPVDGLDVRHSGGALFAPEEQAEIAHFRSFLTRVAADADTCGAGSVHGLASEDLLSLVSPLSVKETFRRAQHGLVGTNPTSAVLNNIGDDASLGAALDTLLEDRRVEERLLDIWNDWLLTEAKTRDTPSYLSSSFPRRTFFNPLQSEGARGTNSCNDSTPANCCRIPEDPRNLDDNDDNDVDPKPQNVACEAKRLQLRTAAGREPLELLRRIWRDGAPAEDMLLANATYVNPSLARAYGQVEANGRTFLDGTTSAFNTSTDDDATEFKRTVLLTSNTNAMQTRVPGGNRWPHQGLLSTPAFLSRYPTTVSNRERTRARMVFELFLGVPVMKLAAFATPEIPAGQSLENLTWDTQPCIVCHALIDPVAANFNHFTGNGGAIAATRPCRYDGMRTPGFGFIALPGQGDDGGVPRVALDNANDCPAPADGAGEGDADNKGPQRLRWLAERVTEHPRFAYAVVVPLYEGIVGTKLIAPPDALADVDFNAKARAFVAQQKEIASLVSTFRAGGGRFQPVVKAILMSRSFRADTLSVDVDDDTARVFELLNLGHKGKLHTPEVLARRIESITGLPWNHVRSVTQADNLEPFGTYSVFWGGHDSEAVTLRSREPVAIRAAVARRLGHELSCVVVPQEFSMVDADDRKVFRLVELTDVPLDADGAELVAVKEKVRTQVARLHTLFWNEPQADNVEIDAGTELFMNALQAMRTNDTPASLSPCQATATFTRERLPYPTSGTAVVDGIERRRVTTDSTYVVRAWMAVLSSVLADPRFIME